MFSFILFYSLWRNDIRDSCIGSALRIGALGRVNLVRFHAISCDLISKKKNPRELSPLFCFSFLKHSMPKRGLSSRTTVTKCLEFARDRYMDESKKYSFLKIFSTHLKQLAIPTLLLKTVILILKSKSCNVWISPRTVQTD